MQHFFLAITKTLPLKTITTRIKAKPQNCRHRKIRCTLLHIRTPIIFCHLILLYRASTGPCNRATMITSHLIKDKSLLLHPFMDLLYFCLSSALYAFLIVVDETTKTIQRNSRTPTTPVAYDRDNPNPQEKLISKRS